VSYLTIPPNKNPPTAKWLSQKSTNGYLFTLQLVGFWIKHFAVGGFFESALRSWWIFIRRGRNIFKMHFSHLRLKQSVLRLQGVSGTIKLVGEVTVEIVNPKNEVLAHLPLVVCESNHLAFPFLGPNWLDKLFPWLTPVHAVSSGVSSIMADFAKKYPNVFSDDLNSAIKGYCVKLRLKTDATPSLSKAIFLALQNVRQGFLKAKSVVSAG